MMEPLFDHERLDVYKASLEFAGFASKLVKGLRGDERHPKGQLLRSSQSVPQNIAEGNGKRSGDERQRYFEIARGSAMESAATLDVLVAIGARDRDQILPGKHLLHRIVSMLTKLAPPRRDDER